jgi:hypothetical protein
MSQPRQTIIFSRQHLDLEQQKRLAELFAHSGYALLKTIIGAHASEQQVSAMNAGLYVGISGIAKDDTNAAVTKATVYSQTLDVLDELELKQEEWFTAKLEHRP